MKTLTNRALIAAAILAAAAFIVGYGRQQQDSGGKYAEVFAPSTPLKCTGSFPTRNSPSSPAATISCFSAALINCWRLWRRFSTRHDIPKATRRKSGAAQRVGAEWKGAERFLRLALTQTSIRIMLFN